MGGWHESSELVRAKLSHRCDSPLVDSGKPVIHQLHSTFEAINRAVRPQRTLHDSRVLATQN